MKNEDIHDRVALAPYTLATKSTELATLLTATSCRIQAVADLSPKPVKSRPYRRQSTLLPICRRFRQQSTLSPVCTGLYWHLVASVTEQLFGCEEIM